MSTFDCFAPLDDLIQVIYQGTHRFVLLSRVAFDAPVPGWDVHLGLADVGRWWTGRWAQKDVSAFVGADVSSSLLETLADNLARALTQGELFVGDWSTAKGAAIKIIFGPTGKTPLAIPLTELSAEEAAVFVANELFSLGLSAQQRKCRLNPPAFPAYPSAPGAAAPRASPPPVKRARRASPSPPPATPRKASGSRTKVVSPPRKTAKDASSAAKERQSTSVPAAEPVGPVKRQARKVQNMDFASDDE